ncbi:MAG: hypothetical protein Q9199_005998 [Rusavskia elegans]
MKKWSWRVIAQWLGEGRRTCKAASAKVEVEAPDWPLAVSALTSSTLLFFYPAFPSNLSRVESDIFLRSVQLGCYHEQYLSFKPQKSTTNVAVTPLNHLVWHDYLAAQATDYASCLASQNLGNQHSSSDQRPDQGENLYSTDGQDGGMAVASDGWGPKEKIFYHGEKIPDAEFEQYGHYTQIIWPTTTNVGIRVAKNEEKRKWYVVAGYSPPGNYGGRDAFNG